MAFTFQSKSWSIAGEKEFENHFTILNPTLSVMQVSVHEENVYISMKAVENGGVFEHNLNVQYNNSAGETDLDVIVDSAVSQAFPEATLNS
jgi:hypothetical protein